MSTFSSVRVGLAAWCLAWVLACASPVEAPSEPGMKAESSERQRPEPGGGGGGSDGGSDRDEGGASSDAPSGITFVGSNTWEIKQRLVDKYENNPGKLCDVHEKGKGWELKRVKKGDCQHLGMLNGDVLKEVNGYGLANEAALAFAYAALKNKKKFDLKFKRDGKTKTFHYKVVN